MIPPARDLLYAAPEVIDLCRAASVDVLLGLSTNPALRAHVATLESSTAARSKGSEKVRRFTEFHDAARSRKPGGAHHRPGRGRAAGLVNTRFIVTSLTGGRGKHLYEQLYCRRGDAENHIKAWKRHLAADRASCTRATANQMRLMPHAEAYWLMWGLRSLMPRRSPRRIAQFDTPRLRLLKIAARVVGLKTKPCIHLPTVCPVQPVLALVLTRMARLVT